MRTGAALHLSAENTSGRVANARHRHLRWPRALRDPKASAHRHPRRWSWRKCQIRARLAFLRRCMQGTTRTGRHWHRSRSTEPRPTHRASAVCPGWSDRRATLFFLLRSCSITWSRRRFTEPLCAVTHVSGAGERCQREDKRRRETRGAELADPLETLFPDHVE